MLQLSLVAIWWKMKLKIVNSRGSVDRIPTRSTHIACFSSYVEFAKINLIRKKKGKGK